MLRARFTISRFYATAVHPAPIKPFTFDLSKSAPDSEVSTPTPNAIPAHLKETSASWLQQADALSHTSPIEAIPIYRKSLFTMPTANAFHNLAVCLYLTKEFDQALCQFNNAIDISKKEISSNASIDEVRVLKRGLCDAYMNAANIYALHFPTQPFPSSKPDQQTAGLDIALHYLELAVKLSTQDGEVRFNYAAILEKKGMIEDALVQYETAVKFGIERAEMCVRNCRAKLIVKETEKKKKN